MINTYELDKYEYISFDIYDTLVFRNVETPSDVFQLLENEYNRIHKDAPLFNIKRNRIIAEKKARKAAKAEEVTIYDIYDFLSKCIKKEEAAELMGLELQIERDICVCNDEIYDLFCWCKDQKKKVILTSDMYLPRECIIDMLERVGISGYDKFYLSSDLLKKKTSGTIFKFMLNDLNIRPENLVHIGDSVLGDFESPQKYGIASILYKRTYIRSKTKKSNEIISSYIKNKNSHIKGEAFKIGYMTLGPILFGFTYWLSLYADKIHAKQILFLSRDGKVIQKAWNCNRCIPDKQENIYFYASRKALIIPSLKSDASLEQIGKKYSFHKYVTLHDILRKVGIYDYTTEKLLQKYALDSEKLYDSGKLFSGCYSEINRFFLEIKPEIEKNAFEQNKAFEAYIKQFKLQEEILVVDIGWNGNMQKALEAYFSTKKSNVKLFGAYVALNPSNTNQQHYNMKGFLCDASHHINLYDELAPFGTILESFFMADHGSVAGYAMKDGVMGPLLENYEFDQCDQVNTIYEIQEGALAFTDEFSQYALNNALISGLSPENYVDAFLDMCKAPSKMEAEIVGSLPFYDTELEYLIATVGNGSGIWKSFCNSRWKIGFMKKMVKLNINYYQLYKLLKKMSFT